MSVITDIILICPCDDTAELMVKEKINPWLMKEDKNHFLTEVSQFDKSPWSMQLNIYVAGLNYMEASADEFADYIASLPWKSGWQGEITLLMQEEHSDSIGVFINAGVRRIPPNKNIIISGPMGHGESYRYVWYVPDQSIVNQDEKNALEEQE